VREPDRKNALQHAELDVGVPLDGQLLVRNRVQDLPQLLQHSRLVERLEGSLVLGSDEGADRSERRRQRDLEAARPGDHAGTLEAGECPVRGDGRLGIAETFEPNVRGPLADPQSQPGESAVMIRARRPHLELWECAEDRVLPDDPVRPWAGLAVGDPAEAGAERGGDGSGHVQRAGTGPGARRGDPRGPPPPAPPPPPGRGAVLPSSPWGPPVDFYPGGGGRRPSTRCYGIPPGQGGAGLPRHTTEVST